MTEVQDEHSEELAEVFRAAARRVEEESLKRLGEFSGGLERRSRQSDPAGQPSELSRLVRNLQLARDFQQDPFGFYGTCAADGTSLRLSLDPGVGIFLCCTGEPVHCEPF